MTAACLSCADGEPPDILSVTMLPDTNEPSGPYSVEAIVSDDRSLSSVQLWWCVEDSGDDTCRTDLDDGYHLVEMEPLDGDTYKAEIPGQGYDVVFEYYILAVDDVGNQATAPPGAPVEEIFSFKVTE